MAGPRKQKRGRPRDATLPERRRDEIADVAAAIFAERGFPSTDLQAVADEAGIGKGTIYRYFGSKKGLFLAATDREMRRLSECVRDAAAGHEEPLERIAAAIRAYLAYFDKHAFVVELLMQERAEFKDRRKPTYFQHRDASIEPWRDLFRGLIREGRVRDVPVARITDVMSDLLYGTIFSNHFASRRKRLERQAEDILDILFHGLLTREDR